METIIYRGVEYPVREIEVIGGVRVSVGTLNDAMFDSHGVIIIADAEALDETIFCYVPAEVFEKSDKDVVEFIKENIL